MRQFVDKVAVVTGAASGIGRALAQRCAAERMKVVLADVEVEALERAAAELRGCGTEVLSVRTDVSDASQVEALAERTMETFGGVHLLFNNAGVTASGFLWEYSLADWQWVLGVNLWGVINGVRSFVPRMLRQGDEGHVVNTASIAGLLSTPGNGIYAASKHAVVSVSETLFLELRSMRARVSVSVICPAWVRSRISDSARNRPPELANPGPERSQSPEAEAVERWKRRAVEGGTPPEEIASQIFDAIRADRFYVIPHTDWLPVIARSTKDILEGENPAMGLPPVELLEELARIKKRPPRSSSTG